MTKDDLIKLLLECEADHGKAEDGLLEFINDEEITAAFIKGTYWYA